MLHNLLHGGLSAYLSAIVLFNGLVASRVNCFFFAEYHNSGQPPSAVSTVDLAVSGVGELPSWEHFLKTETRCVESDFLMLEIYFGVHTSSQRLIERKRRSCPSLSSPIRFDPFTRKRISLSVFPVEHLFSHPQYRMESFHRSPRHILKFLHDVENTFSHVLQVAERDALRHIAHRNASLTNIAIPVLCGDYSRTIDTHPNTQFLFYIGLRHTINRYVGTSALRFFTTPKFCRHITGVQKAVGDMMDAYPKYISHYRFDSTQLSFPPENLQRSLKMGIVIGADTVSITTRVVNAPVYVKRGFFSYDCRKIHFMMPCLDVVVC